MGLGKTYRELTLWAGMIPAHLLAYTVASRV